MLLSNKILFAGCYFVKFTSVVHCDILCVLLFQCICAYIIEVLTYLLTYLLAQQESKRMSSFTVAPRRTNGALSQT